MMTALILMHKVLEIARKNLQQMSALHLNKRIQNICN